MNDGGAKQARESMEATLFANALNVVFNMLQQLRKYVMFHLQLVNMRLQLNWQLVKYVHEYAGVKATYVNCVKRYPAY